MRAIGHSFSVRQKPPCLSRPAGDLRSSPVPITKRVTGASSSTPVAVPPHPAVVPAEADAVEVESGVGGRLQLAGDIRGLPAVDPRADEEPLGRFLGLRERLVVHRHLPRPRVVPAGDVQDRHIGVVGDVIDDGHPLDLPEGGVGAAGRSAS